MIEGQSVDLLIDLLKLFKKYGPEPFEELALFFESGEDLKRLETILKTVGTIKKPESIGNEKKKLQYIIPSLVKIKTRNREKYELLLNIYNEMVSNPIFPKISDINDLLVEYNFPEIKTRSRKKAIKYLIESLIELPEERIKKIHRFTKEDRSLEAWSDIILNDKMK